MAISYLTYRCYGENAPLGLAGKLPSLVQTQLSGFCYIDSTDTSRIAFLPTRPGPDIQILGSLSYPLVVAGWFSEYQAQLGAHLHMIDRFV